MEKHRRSLEETSNIPEYTANQSAIDGRGRSFDDGQSHVREELWATISKRRSDGEVLRAEEFLAQAGPDTEAALDLIYADFALRCQAGKAPSIDEYVERFPAYANAIRRQFLIHEELSSAFDNTALVYNLDSDVRLDGNQLPETPEKFGKFTVVAKLDSGGQANVYRVIHPALGKELVLKVSTRSLREGSAANRLLEEGRLIADLDHPNLARIYDMGLHEGHPYLAMEYIRGRTLHHYVQEQKVTSSEAAVLVASIADAVAAAHARNIVHLDIKPKNVLIDEKGKPFLVDFGLSRLLDPNCESDPAREISGTLQYMAPEQARADYTLIGRRTDVFGLGGILYFLLTKSAPFPGLSAAELLPRISKGEWDTERLSSAAVPRTLRGICARAMAPEVKDRFSSVNELSKVLRRFKRLEKLREWSLRAAMFSALVALLYVGLHSAWPAPKDGDPTIVGNMRQPNGQYVDMTNAMPLRNGDELRFVCEIPAHTYAGLYLFTSAGELQQLASWDADSKRRKVQFPEGAATAPLNGPPGTECLLLCVDPTEALTLEKLRSAWSSHEPLKRLPEYTVAEIDSGDIRFKHFSRGLGITTHNDDPEIAFRDDLKPVVEKLTGHFTGVAGVAFSHR